jgi:pyruvate formate lyase activating enzyme
MGTPVKARKITRKTFLKTVFSSAMCFYGGTMLTANAEEKEQTQTNLHEAMFYEPLSDGKVKCKLCPRGCIVPPGGRGYCRVRENKGGKLFSMVYGKACTKNCDPIEKKPFFHVLPGSKSFSIATAGCNFACLFCQNWDISQATPESFDVQESLPQQIVEEAMAAKAKSIAYTYAEPVVFYEYMLECTRLARKEKLANVMVSNGFIREEPLRNLLKELTAIKIDFKAFTDSFYEKVCEGELESVKKTLKVIAETKVWLEVVVLLIPTLNDSQEEIKRMSGWLAREIGTHVPLHFSRFTPMYKLRNLPRTPIETLHKAREIAMQEGMQFVYIGNVPGEEGENTFCPSCKKILIRRFGYSILESKIQNGKCAYCNAVIPGVWM